MDLQLSGTGSGPPPWGWDGASETGPSRSQGIAKVPSALVLGTEFTRGSQVRNKRRGDLISQEPRLGSHDRMTAKLHLQRGSGELGGRPCASRAAGHCLWPGSPHGVTNRPSLPGTCSVLELRVPPPGSSLDPRQTETIGHSSSTARWKGRSPTIVSHRNQ